MVLSLSAAVIVMPGPEIKPVPATFSKIAATEEELISWDADRKLTWDDYRGEPDPSTDAAASTTTRLTVSYQFKKDGYRFTIRSGFDPYRSWGTHRTAYILSHEQGHFDLAEVYARKLFRNLSEYRFDANNYRKDLKKIYDDVIKEKEAIQNEYDEETRHSILKAKQAEWLKKIAAMLEETNEYASY